MVKNNKDYKITPNDIKEMIKIYMSYYGLGIKKKSRSKVNQESDHCISNK